MSYHKKSALIFTVAVVLGFTVAMGAGYFMAFVLFGAYMPDGLSLTGYVYGLADSEAIITTIAAVFIMLGTTTSIIGAGENRLGGGAS